MNPDYWTKGTLTEFKMGNVIVSSKETISIIIGLEDDVDRKEGDKWKSWLVSPIQILQWTMASAPNHIVLNYTIDLILSKIPAMSRAEIKASDASKLTGPGPWSFSVYRYWKDQGVDWEDMRHFGSRPKLVGDMLVLPTTGFS